MRNDAVSMNSSPARARRRRRALGIAGAGVAAGMTVLWIAVVPEKANTTTGLQEAAIRWGHPACWALLTIVAVFIAIEAPKRVRDAIAYAAGACYAGFLLAILL